MIFIYKITYIYKFENTILMTKYYTNNILKYTYKNDIYITMKYTDTSL